MDDWLLIFVAGTAASFLPIYYVFSLFVRRRRWLIAPTISSRGSREVRKAEFLDLLRREALSRIRASLEVAEAEVLGSAGGGRSGNAPSDVTLRQLREIARLVETLFPPSIKSLFDHHVSTLGGASPAARLAAAAANAAILVTIERSVANAPACERATLPAKPAAAAASAREAFGLAHDKPAVAAA